jgi:hypothetical protein
MADGAARLQAIELRLSRFSRASWKLEKVYVLRARIVSSLSSAGRRFSVEQA